MTLCVDRLLSTEKMIVIWGARMTGLGLLRKLDQLGVAEKVIFFVDSDPAFLNASVRNKAVLTPEQLSHLLATEELDGNDIIIAIATALKDSEVGQLLSEYKISCEVAPYTTTDQAHYTIDIMGACNLRCGSCPQGIPSNGVPKGSMSMTHFKSVISKIKTESPSTSHIALYSWGEPLIHPDLPEMINIAHEAGLAVALSSNLSLAGNFHRRLREIVKSGPDYLKISVSGYSQEVYEQTHQGGSVDLVKSNLFLLKHFLDSHSSSSTLVDINYHLYRNNGGSELNKFKNLAKELGFLLSTTHALLMPVERIFDLLDGHPDKEAERLDRELFLIPTVDSISISSHEREPITECPFALNQLNINADLSVPVCCTVFSRGENLVSNNYLSSDLRSIKKNKMNASICKRCMHERLPEYNLGFNRSGREKYILHSAKEHAHSGANEESGA